jgi:hypothetical protein
MKNKKFFIHIGNFKTGSTTLQKFLFLNKKLLKKNNIGVIYDKENFFKKNINNMLLFKYLDNLNENKIFYYLKRNKEKHLIISSEYFSCISLDIKKIKLLKKMIIKLGYEPNIIFFSRNGPMFFYSFYREILKQNKSLKIKDNVFDYLQKIKKYGYYFYNKNDKYYLGHNFYFKNNLINKNWKKIFKKNFISIKFDKKHKSKLLHDFINILELKNVDFKIPEIQNKTTIKFWHLKRIFNYILIYFYYFLILNKINK